MKIINSKIIDKNVKIGDIIISNILNTGTHIIATKTIQI
jgi:CxxC motif-containing protein